MALSKPTDIIFNFTSMYFQYLYSDPVKTKAITSCILNGLGNYVYQKARGIKYINEDRLIAFGLFGLFFGGPVPHYFHLYIRSLVKHPLAVLLTERLIFTPCFQALALYMLARFEGKSDKASKEQLKKLYWPVLIANLKYLTLLHYINVKYVPAMLRTLLLDMINFLWSIYLTNQYDKVTTST
ncbi:hypothetical protein KPH14_001735 [Odynerus spinipes]|uniref:Peroxisomal membrane protein 2 n=1 Tax=Odynerus spinipes TaxID=1348599 RepID=A0AAD9RZL4_9HYME|nr:hypothetical protein KPH14_001735 [Odynerus spinipes]